MSKTSNLDDASHRGLRNLATLTGGRLVVQAILVATAVVMPRVLGVESYGLLAAVLAVVNILQAVSFCGLDAVEIRYLAPLWREGARDECNELASSIWTARLILSLVAAAGVGLWLSVSPTLELGLVVILAAAVHAALRYVGEATRGLLLALGLMAKLTLVDVLRAIFSLVLMVAGFAMYGFIGVIWALALASLAMLLIGLRAVPSRLQLHVGRFRGSVLTPHVRYCFGGFAGTVAMAIQSQFAIYAVASWVEPVEAGYLAVAIHFYVLCQGLFVTAKLSVMPVLAELERNNRAERLRLWGSLMIRFSAAIGCMTAVIWAFLGRDLVIWALTDEYAAVYDCVRLLAAGMAFYFGASVCCAFLVIRLRSGLASAQVTLYALVTGGGMLLAVGAEPAGAAHRISAVYAIAALIHFGSAYFSLGLSERLWLPLRRMLWLLLPELLIVPIESWNGGFGLRVAGALSFGILYPLLVVKLELLPAHEIKQLVHTWRSAKRREPIS